MRNEREHLEQFLSLLRELEGAFDQIDIDDQTCFAGVLEQSMVFLNLQPRDIAEEFSTSEASVSRWRMGRNTPYRAIRKLVYDGLRRRTASAARAAEQLLKSVSGLSTSEIRTRRSAQSECAEGL